MSEVLTDWCMYSMYCISLSVRNTAVFSNKMWISQILRLCNRFTRMQYLTGFLPKNIVLFFTALNEWMKEGCQCKGKKKKKTKQLNLAWAWQASQSSYITTVLFVFDRPSKNSWIYNSNLLSQTDEPRLGTQAGPKQLLSVCPLRRPLILPIASQQSAEEEEGCALQ